HSTPSSPGCCGDKLQLAGVDHHLTSWILDYLTHRLTVCEGAGSSESVGFSAAPTGAPCRERFWLLSCSPSTLQTFHTIHHHVISRSSLMTLLLLASSHRWGRQRVQRTYSGLCGLDWCLRNNLQINASVKTKELVVDFRRRRSTLRLHRLLGQQHHGQGQEENRDRLVRRASSVLGCPLDSVEVVGNGRMMAKLSSLLNNTSHPLQDTLTALGSSFSERLLHPCCVKE
ncbi:hypothetical protein L3Q82_025303, partial [Scortum barcoo]